MLKTIVTSPKRQSLRIAVAILFLATCACPSPAQEPLKKLLVAYAGLISTHSSVWLGEDQGFYKKHGLDVTSVFTGSGSVTSQALMAGEAKLASTSVGPTAGANSGGADLVILAGLIHILPYQLWVHPQVRQPADLKGKRVAISTFGSGSHLAVEVALQHLGLEPAETRLRSCRSDNSRREWRPWWAAGSTRLRWTPDSRK